MDKESNSYEMDQNIPYFPSLLLSYLSHLVFIHLHPGPKHDQPKLHKHVTFNILQLQYSSIAGTAQPNFAALHLKVAVFSHFSCLVRPAQPIFQQGEDENSDKQSTKDLYSQLTDSPPENSAIKGVQFHDGQQNYFLHIINMKNKSEFF